MPIFLHSVLGCPAHYAKCRIRTLISDPLRQISTTIRCIPASRGIPSWIGKAAPPTPLTTQSGIPWKKSASSPSGIGRPRPSRRPARRRMRCCSRSILRSRRRNWCRRGILLHGGGFRLNRPHRRRPPATGFEPRLALAGHRWLAQFRLCAVRGQKRRLHGAPAYGSVFPIGAGQRLH